MNKLCLNPLNKRFISLTSINLKQFRKSTPKNLDFNDRKLILNTMETRYRTRNEDVKYDVEEILKTDPASGSSDKIMVPADSKSEILNGVPDEHKYERTARIFMPPKPATQSGTHGTTFWVIEFDNRQRWENNLMGWSSTGDPLSNMQLKFPSAEEAKRFCDEQGYKSIIEEPQKPYLKSKSYGSNFSWNKRTRNGTK